MSETEVIDLLRDWMKKVKKDFPTGVICFSATEISRILSDKANSKNISRAITRLQKHKEIESIKISVDTAKKIYGTNMKRGMQLFFVVED